jgi:hypothetical protein
MEFLGIIQDSKYVSRRLFQSDLFLKNAIPLYQRYRNGTFLSSDIYLPHCMGCSLSALIDVGTKVTMQNVPHPLPLPPSGAISELILNDMISSTTLAESDDDDLAESDDDDLVESDDDDEYDDDNNDDDNYNDISTDDNTYSYDYDNTVSAAQKQKANNNELIAPACPTCPRKKDRVLAVDNKIHNDNSNTYIHDKYIRNNTNADEDECLDYNFDYAAIGLGPICHDKQRKLEYSMSSMSSKKSVTSSMSRKVSVAYTAKVMKNLPPANNGIDNMSYLKGYHSAQTTPPDFRDITKKEIRAAPVSCE